MTIKINNNIIYKYFKEKYEKNPANLDLRQKKIKKFSIKRNKSVNII